MSESPQRILHIPRRFSTSDWGGTEAVITALCEAQLAQGWQPEIHTSMALNPNRSERFRTIPVHRYPYCYPFLGLCAEDRNQLDQKGGNLLSWPLYRALRKAKDVRIFHAHVTKRTGASVLKAARLARRPCVVTLHGNMFDVPEIEAADVVPAQAGKFEWGRAFGAYFGSRRMLHEVDAVLCVGFSEYEKARAALGSERVHFLPNGVHPERFNATQAERTTTRNQLGCNDTTFLYGCISRLDPQKNQVLLINAFCRIAAQDPNAALVLCGPITNLAYHNTLKAAAEASGFGQRIRILPPVTPDTPEHRGLFAALDCFVLPSRHEPFGIVVLEAWAAGKPVIAANVGGLSRLVSHEKNGLHFESGHCEALVAAMQRIRTVEALRRSTVEQAQREIQQRYTWTRLADQLETIYQQVAEKYR
ncbi:MAG: glycosyltransferase involved in cell wall biosynthesis [Lentimonas sp.]|jgi:glycosyltransferase involved in cell wall biosynthesis